MLRLLLTRALPSAAIAGAAIHRAADAATSSADAQLITGLLTTLGAVIVAGITGYFGLLIARSRAPQVVPAVEHERVADTAEASNRVLVDEIARKELVIARLSAELAAMRAEIERLRRGVDRAAGPDVTA